ncbi:hypothetical protein C8Q77DRAFT_1155383 [Trametes polyzona]|nr:hypothetical protein C8Q77DRAFT_1155383 [Trametes polyzona]
MSSYRQRLDALASRIDTFEVDVDADERREDSTFVNLLVQTATVVRDAEKAGAPVLEQIISKAADLFDNAVSWAYTDGDYDFLPSYAHSDSDPLHDDQYFGYAYDAGEHVLCHHVAVQYQYKEGPDPTVLPAYWKARANDGYRW